MAETWQTKQIISAKGIIDNEGVPRGILIADDDSQVVQIVDVNGNKLTTKENTHNSKPELLVNLEGHVCDDNSSSTPLGISGVFPGAWQDTIDYGTITVGVKADEDSATDGLLIEWSADGVTAHDLDSFTILANRGKVFTFAPARRYFKVSYTNGATAQGSFNLQSVLRRYYIKPSSHRIQDSIVAEDDAELGKSVITGQSDDGVFRNVKSTEDGTLAISDQSNGLSIARGLVTGASFIHKFGAAPDFDIADGFVTVWDGAEDGEDYEQMVYNYSTSADIDYISAEDNGDTQEVEIQGLDANYDLVVQTKTLAGNTPVELDTYLIRVFRMKNVGSVDFAGHVFCYVSGGTVTGGVPQVGADVRAVVHGSNNQTEMAVFTIPAGMTGYMRDWYASTAGARKDSSHTIRVLARPFGQVFQLKHTGNIDVNGTSYIKHTYVEPERFAEKTDIEIRMNTSENEAGVAAGFDIVLIDN